MEEENQQTRWALRTQRRGILLQTSQKVEDKRHIHLPAVSVVCFTGIPLGPSASHLQQSNHSTLNRLQMSMRGFQK